MKKSEAQKLIDQAVEKAMGTPLQKDWITINGTHVEVNGDGDIVTGPGSLKDRNGSGSGKSKGEGKSGNKIKGGKIPNMAYMSNDDKEKLQKDIVKVTPEKRKPQLNESEYKRLEDGNRYTFSSLLADYYPDFCEEVGFGRRERANSYKSWVDYSDGIYTVRNKNNDKYYFNTKLEFRGAEAY